MATRTICGKRMSESAYNRRAATIIRKALPSFPMGPSEWADLRYSFNIGEPAEKIAAAIVERRSMEMHCASRTNCRVWRDEFGGGVQVRPDSVPPAVADTIRAAFENGCGHGTVFHWEPVRRPFATGDHTAEVYTWEKL